TDAIFWSLAYRSNPGEDVQILTHRSAGHGPKSDVRADATILIDATLKHDMPPLALPRREFMNAREQSGTSWGCRQFRPSRLGMPPHWEAGTSAMMFMPAERSRGDGRKAAKKPSNVAAKV